jgi:chromosome segregation ATPase
MNSRLTGTLLVMVLVSALPAIGQDGATDQTTARLSDEMRGIRQSLDRIVDLLETLQRRQDVDLLLKRIELRERRLDPLESRLRSAESEIQGTEDHLHELDKMEEQHEEILNEEIREGSDAPRSETRRILDDIQRTREAQEERLEAVRMRLQQYENDLARGRETIEILDEMLDELLEDKRR